MEQREGCSASVPKSVLKMFQLGPTCYLTDSFRRVCGALAENSDELGASKCPIQRWKMRGWRAKRFMCPKKFKMIGTFLPFSGILWGLAVFMTILSSLCRDLLFSGVKE